MCAPGAGGHTGPPLHYVISPRVVTMNLPKFFSQAKVLVDKARFTMSYYHKEQSDDFQG